MTSRSSSRTRFGAILCPPGRTPSRGPCTPGRRFLRTPWVFRTSAKHSNRSRGSACTHAGKTERSSSAPWRRAPSPGMTPASSTTGYGRAKRSPAPDPWASLPCTTHSSRSQVTPFRSRATGDAYSNGWQICSPGASPFRRATCGQPPSSHHNCYDALTQLPRMKKPKAHTPATEMRGRLCRNIETLRPKLMELAAAHGTPLYVYEPERVRQNLRTFRDGFAHENVPMSIFYAVKSNSYPGLLRTVAEEAAGVGGSRTRGLAPPPPAGPARSG